jgi:hypothetical protein
MIRYYGCLSSHSSLRKEVVPKPAPAVQNPLLDDGDGQLALGFEDSDAEVSSGQRRPWAFLLRHVWQVDVSTCSRCGGPMRWVEVATEPDAIRRVLAELERPRSEDGPAEHPSTSRWVRPPPPEQLGLGFG